MGSDALESFQEFPRISVALGGIALEAAKRDAVQFGEALGVELSVKGL